MRLGLTIKLLLLVLIAALPSLAALSLSQALIGTVDAAGQQTIRIAVVALALLWASVVAIGGRAWIAVDTNAVVASAERRIAPDQPATAAAERIARLLERRDRQLQTLAESVATAPISSGAAGVLRHMVRATQLTAEDETWFGVLLRSAHPGDVGTYLDETSQPGPVQDLHQWAAISASSPHTPTISDGPWGAFMILRLGEMEDVKALLMAPWEGRAELSRTDAALFTLIAQHGSGALAHAALFARVQTQAHELDRLAALQADFLRGVTHDLQSPLASINAAAAELRDMAAPEVAGGLESIEHQAGRLRRMVTQLLTMSGVEAGIVAPVSEVFRSEAVVRRVIESLRQPEERIRHERSGPDRLAVGDPDRLEQVIWAVLDNALKYSPDGGIVRVEQSAEATAAGLVERIDIVDEGIGMDAETIRHAFDQFYRAPRARTVAPNGSGIGLYTAKALVELMGGSISVDSTADIGTRVRIRLVAEPAADDEGTRPP